MKLLTTAALCIGLSSPVMAANEDTWNRYVCAGLGGEPEAHTPINTRVDCLTNTHAYEADWDSKIYEAIGQAMSYAAQMNRKPGVIFLCRRSDAICQRQYLVMVEAIGEFMTLENWDFVLVDATGEPGS